MALSALAIICCLIWNETGSSGRAVDEDGEIIGDKGRGNIGDNFLTSLFLMSTRRIGVLNVVAVGQANFPVTAENLAVALERNQVASESRSGAVDE